MKYDFNETVDRTGTASITLEAGEKVNPYLPNEHIPLWVADMDFACAPDILQAMRERLDRRILGYTNLSGDCEASACRWMERRFGWKPEQEQIDFLRSNRCDEVQGFYFYRPLPMEELKRLHGLIGRSAA